MVSERFQKGFNKRPNPTREDISHRYPNKDDAWKFEKRPRKHSSHHDLEKDMSYIKLPRDQRLQILETEGFDKRAKYDPCSRIRAIYYRNNKFDIGFLKDHCPIVRLAGHTLHEAVHNEGFYDNDPEVKNLFKKMRKRNESRNQN